MLRLLTLRGIFLTVCLAIGLEMAACQEAGESETPAPKDAPPARFTLTSSAFKDGKPIPVKYTGDGKNVSPPLA